MQGQLPLEVISGSHGQISAHIKKYLREKYNNKCARCGWNTPHPSDGIPPLEVEHIDGNWRNSIESNLILLCPNCYSLTTTYKNRNRGNGKRPNRKQREYLVWRDERQDAFFDNIVG